MGRFYDKRKWRHRTRLKVLKRDHYKCQGENCGKLVSGRDAQVDHIARIEDGGREFALSNLQTLCINCHSSKTVQDKRGPTKRDARGMPTDPDHPWNKEDPDE